MIFLKKLRARPLCIAALVLILIITLNGLIRGSTINELPFEKLIENEDEIKVWGKIVKLEFKQKSTFLTLDNTYLEINSKEYFAGKIIAIAPLEEFFEIGSEIKGEGIVSHFTKATNSGQFDEYDYYKSLGINTRVNLEDFDVNPEKSSLVETFLARVRIRLSESINNSFLSEGEKGIVNAMVLGDKTDLSKEQKDLYRTAGIIHIISISGLHISILGMGLFRLLRKRGISYLFSCFLSSFVILGFVIMTGGSVSSLRALIMFVISMGAEYLGRSTDIFSSISLAAILLLLDNPGIVSNSGFVLSFGAVMGIGFWGDLCKLPKDKGKEVWWKYHLRRLCNTVLGGIGLVLFTAPIVLYYYYELPVFSFISNIIVIPLAPLLLIGGIIAAFVGIYFMPVANGIFAIPKVVLSINEGLARVIEAIPNSTIIVGKPSVFGVVIYYGALILLKIMIKKLKRKLIIVNCNDRDKKGDEKHSSIGLKALILNDKENVRYWCGVLGLLTIMIISLSFRPRFSDMITVMDVGQGECILIRCKSGENVLIDAGSSTVSKVGEQRIIPCLKCLGIGEIDKMILTHEDGDHTSGVEEILSSNIKVNEVLLAKTQVDRGCFADIIEKNDFKYELVGRGDGFTMGDVKFNIISPEYDSGFSDNESSVVVEMVTDSTSVLFTGDIEGEGEQELINSGRLHHVDMLKVAHHGSRNSTSDELLNITAPKLALISAGKRNSYGHPHKETIEKLSHVGCKYMVTKDLGAITIALD